MKKFKFASISVLLPFLIIAVVVLANVLLSEISERKYLKADLTRDRVYNFSNQTEKVLENTKEEVYIYALYPENGESDAKSYVSEYLSKYSRMNKNIKVSYVDPYENPNFTKKYENAGEAINAGSVIVESGDMFKVLDIESLFVQNSYTGETGIDVEKKLTCAIAYVTKQSGGELICFSEGHGEQSALGLMRAFEDEGYTCETVNLSLNGINNSAAILVICAPQKDLTAEEIDYVDSYADSGGSILYIAAPGIEKLERTESYLSEWGISPTGDYVIEADSSRAYASTSGIPVPAPYINSHTITDNIIESGFILMAPNSESLKISSSNPRSAKVTPLLTTSEKAYGKTNLSSETTKMEEGDNKGPLTLGAISEDSGKKSGKVFVIGSYNTVDESFLSESGYANADFIQNAAAYLADKENPFDIRAKVISAENLTMSETNVIITHLVVQYIIPFIIFAVGLFVWLKRRYM